jgi:hypothetical protein
MTEKTADEMTARESQRMLGGNDVHRKGNAIGHCHCPLRVALSGLENLVGSKNRLSTLLKQRPKQFEGLRTFLPFQAHSTQCGQTTNSSSAVALPKLPVPARFGHDSGGGSWVLARAGFGCLDAARTEGRLGWRQPGNMLCRTSPAAASAPYTSTKLQSEGQKSRQPTTPAKSHPPPSVFRFHVLHPIGGYSVTSDDPVHRAHHSAFTLT